LTVILKEKSPKSEGEVTMPMLLQSMQNNSDLKAEISSMKTLLLASIVRSNGSSGNTSSTGEGAFGNPTDLAALAAAMSSSSNQTSAHEKMNGLVKSEEVDPNELKKKEHLEKSREALATMMNDCPDDDELLSAGCGMLLMFLKNILKDPLNPRYRRVAKGNANFKKSVEPLKGYLNFFESVGFDDRGVQLELRSEWTESLEISAENGWAKAVIEDAVLNLEKIREQRSPYVTTGGTTTPATAVATSTSSNPPSFTNSPMMKPTTPVPSNLSSASSMKLPEPMQNPVPPPPGRVAARPAVQASPDTMSTPAAEPVPTYPPSFADIVRMQQEGKKPDGIKDIPDRLSSDEPSRPTLTPLPKPWEQQSIPASNLSAAQVFSPKVDIQEVHEENGEE